MKKLTAVFLTILLSLALLCGCSVNINLGGSSSSAASKPHEDLSSAAQELRSSLEKIQSDLESSLDKANSDIVSNLEQNQSSGKESKGSYTMADIKKLKNTGNFAKNTLEHIFDGTINSKGNATGYHYTGVTDSKGEVIAGTESKKDAHGVFTGKVKVSGVKKNGFSSFYPEEWTPQQVVDAINEAYKDALSDKSNPHGDLWIGYSGDLEIDMYLNSSKKITTAFPVYEGD